jgi:hypothetical protein
MNEFHIMRNPDNVPGAVSSGYQRQNNNLYALQTGMDTTEPYDNGQGVITIPADGVVDLNGVLFKLTADIVLQKSDPDTCYWVAIEDGGQGTASAKLVTRPGAWSPAWQGCYTFDSNMRTLNWVSLGELANLTEEPIFSQNVKGRWEVPLRKGWYYADLASGKGGGDASGRQGGVATVSKTLRFPFFHDGKKPVRVKVGGDGFNGGTSPSNGGFGGGSGAGEESEIAGIAKTDRVHAGNSGSGQKEGFPGTGGGGSPNGLGGGYGFGGGGNGASTGGGGGSGGSGGIDSDRSGGSSRYGENGGNGAGSTNPAATWGGGGGGGAPGWQRPEGGPGGHCYIYPMAG